MSAINFRFANSFRNFSSRSFYSKKTIFSLVSAVSATTGAAYTYERYFNSTNGDNGGGKFIPGKKYAAAFLAAIPDKNKDYQEVYNAIAQKLVDQDDYDDGSYGPVLVRLAWHQSGTFRKHPSGPKGCPYSENAGGSFGGTMRYEYEGSNPANNGLDVARKFLEEFKQKYPYISYGDLYTLGGVVSVQELGGPKIPWRAGRKDLTEKDQAPNGRLPDGAKGADHIRELFGPHAMGFNDQEITALIGAHCLGRCHVKNSGFDGPWTFSPTFFTNDFYKLLMDGDWHIREWNGSRQFEDDATKSLMMLPADMAIKTDPKFAKYARKYADDQDLFFKDFTAAFVKLLELGIEFPKNSKTFNFKTLDEQEQ
ncbi:hypothetical protein PACTADRAFT_49767 [Pachysolen tannophilus NRRL Y-2460]|uniref:Peroxidase n=1 Tax=Pachysolen tannophilus NRRL Y-2460 TaxID=669874 RepID=A0A1E4TXC6_PACTA|nr:hypothetical protein PACTADRAFT_49767 [Pachysolen tannophilus NRRL Y-2460]